MSGGLYIGGDTSGSVLLYPTPVAGSTTITIAAQSGTLNVAGPTFWVYASANTSLTNGAFVKVPFDTAIWNTGSFSTSTNRFTPNVAGYYQFTASVGIQAGNGPDDVYIIKNGGSGSNAATGRVWAASGVQYYIFNTSTMFYLNGTTDYVEVYADQNSGSTGTLNGTSSFADRTYFTGFLARTA